MKQLRRCRPDLVILMDGYKTLACAARLGYDEPDPGNRLMARWLQVLYSRSYSALNYRLRTAAGGRLADRCRPVSPVFLLTELCNARCVHCDIWKNKGREDSPSADQWKKVLSDLRAWLGPVQVSFSGGEALLKPFTIDLVAHCASVGLLLEVLTHGYWEDQSRIEKLAMARPWRVTVSLDGIGETHTAIRGRAGFFEKTHTTLQTLLRMRNEKQLDYRILLKNVLMEHNLDDACAVARFAAGHGMRVFYQPIEQNYNTTEDPAWFEHSPNWPKDTGKAVATVRELIRLKREGLPIDNSYPQLEAMIPYFGNPDALRVSTQSHTAHERRASCAALSMLQFQANGDVRVCVGQEPVGNIKQTPIREIWEKRPRFWRSGCCMEWRCTDAEKAALSLTTLTK